MARYCDGITRRDVLRVGAVGSLGLSLSGYLRMAQAGQVKQAPARQAIVVWLGGGPPHMDTFDKKPDSPEEVRALIAIAERGLQAPEERAARSVTRRALAKRRARR